MVRVVELEGETEDGRDRRERDVTLVPVEADARDRLALPLALADDAAVDQRGGIGTGLRRRQGKAGNFLAASKPGQVAVLLLLGTVVQQQLGRAQRIRHADRAGGNRAAAGELLDDDRVGVRRELEAAVLLRDDHREELLLDDVVPDLPRQVADLVVDLPVVDHAAEFFAGTVDERLLFLRELRRREGHQLVPVGHAREQLAIPPDVSGFQRLPLRIRHRRQHLPIDFQEWLGDLLASNLDQVRHHHQREQGPEDDQPPPRTVTEYRVGDQRETCGNRRRAQIDALVSEIDCAADEQQRP